MALDADTVLRALRRMGERLPPNRDVELVIAGGGAAMQAHRRTDIEHLEQLRPPVNGPELEFVDRHLDSQASIPGADQGRIERTRVLIREWRARDAGTEH